MAGESSSLVISALQDELVRRAETIVGWIDVATAERSGKAQVSRAIGTADAEGATPRVFVNWLRYQAAREKDYESFWTRAGRDRVSVAQAVAREVAWIEREVAARRGTPDNATTMKAVARFLGYLRRALIGAPQLERIPLSMAGEQS